MRCKLSDKNARKLAKKLGMPIEMVLVRGNTDHRMDLCLTDGTVVCLYKDGTMEKSDIGWGKDIIAKKNQ